MEHRDSLGRLESQSFWPGSQERRGQLRGDEEDALSAGVESPDSPLPSPVEPDSLWEDAEGGDDEGGGAPLGREDVEGGAPLREGDMEVEEGGAPVERGEEAGRPSD